METFDLLRSALFAEINARTPEDEQEAYKHLVDKYGPDNVWDTEAVTEKFIIDGFLAPYVVAINRQTKEKGTLTFCHHPRFYFDWRPQ